VQAGSNKEKHIKKNYGEGKEIHLSGQGIRIGFLPGEMK